MGRLTAVLGVGVLATTLSSGWGPRADLGAADSTNQPEQHHVAPAAEADGALQEILQSAETPAYVARDEEGARLWKQTRTFYEKRQFKPAWIENGSPRPQMGQLISAVRAGERDGLNPGFYNVAALEQRRQEVSGGFLSAKRFEPNEAAAIDASLSYLYMKYASDFADGVSDLNRADPAWKIKPSSFDPLDRLERALQDKRVGESLAELAPDAPGYRALRDALAQYRKFAARGGWSTVPADIKLKPGQLSEHVPAVARRLAATGDYAGPMPVDGQPAVYSTELQEAVKRFQRRHGLADDAVVGAAAAAEMNVSADARVRQIELSLERWRWLPRQMGDRYILVNIPEMRLDVWERGTVGLTMRVVVGKKQTPTPIFSEEMTYLVFSPYWNVPPDIAKNETLPSVVKDAGFLDRMNMEIVDRGGNRVDAASIDLSSPGQYRFRQRPGASNSLGLVKFMFPNQFNVYLHDTPADSLFARASRAFSHGCVRLEQPDKLAAYVLRDQPDWTPERIGEAMQGGQERTVKLNEPLPVYIGYWTASVSADGLVQFRKDIYGSDGRLTARLAERVPSERAALMTAANASSPSQMVDAAAR
jgi:murein L,D-transpeptidase YcbB/YkuD